MDEEESRRAMQAYLLSLKQSRKVKKKKKKAVVLKAMQQPKRKPGWNDRFHVDGIIINQPHTHPHYRVYFDSPSHRRQTTKRGSTSGTRDLSLGSRGSSIIFELTTTKKKPSQSPDTSRKITNNSTFVDLSRSNDRLKASLNGSFHRNSKCKSNFIIEIL